MNRKRCYSNGRTKKPERSYHSLNLQLDPQVMVLTVSNRGLFRLEHQTGIFTYSVWHMDGGFSVRIYSDYTNLVSSSKHIGRATVERVLTIVLAYLKVSNARQLASLIWRRTLIEVPDSFFVNIDLSDDPSSFSSAITNALPEGQNVYSLNLFTRRLEITSLWFILQRNVVMKTRKVVVKGGGGAVDATVYTAACLKRNGAILDLHKSTFVSAGAFYLMYLGPSHSWVYPDGRSIPVESHLGFRDFVDAVENTYRNAAGISRAAELYVRWRQEVLSGASVLDPRSPESIWLVYLEEVWVKLLEEKDPQFIDASKVQKMKIYSTRAGDYIKSIQFEGF